MEIKINGKPIRSAPGSYVTLARTWKTGDSVTISMPMTLRTEGFQDNPKRLALMYGPLVLCAETEPANGLTAIVANNAHILDTVKPEPGSELRFSASPAVFRTGLAERDKVTFLPFYQEYQNPYAVYWDVTSPLVGSSVSGS